MSRRGDVLCTPEAPLTVADQFEAHVLWMDDEPMLPGRPYVIKLGARSMAGPSSTPNTRSTSTPWSTSPPRPSN